MAEKAKLASDAEIRSAAVLLLEAEYAIALTGAGMSVESGIPPFRGPGGLWTKYGEPPMTDFQDFMADPKKGWEKRLARRNDEMFMPLQIAKPNPGHFAHGRRSCLRHLPARVSAAIAAVVVWK